MLREQGINHKMNGRIKPSKHPYIKAVTKCLRDKNIKYKYFTDSENIVVLSVNDVEHINIKECMISPNSNGITIISFYSTEDEQKAYDYLLSLQSIVKNIFPVHLNYEILGFS